MIYFSKEEDLLAEVINYLTVDDLRALFPAVSFPSEASKIDLPGIVLVASSAPPNIDPRVERIEDAPAVQIAGVWTRQWQVVALPNSEVLALIVSRQAELLTQINNLCDQKMTSISSGYPESEVKTWPQQVKEAEAYTANSAAPVPMLEGLATQRSLTVAELASRVLVKATTYAGYAGLIVGRRQALEDALALTTINTPDGVLDPAATILAVDTLANQILAGWPI